MRSAIIAVGLVMTTAVLYAQHVDVDSDPGAPFSTYKTYGWVDGTPAPDPLNDQRLHASIDNRLAARGLVKNAAQPDVVVATHVTTTERVDFVPSGFGLGGWWGAAAEPYMEGTLIVDFYDGKTKKMVWRGVAHSTASEKPSKNAEKMNKALDKMFAKLPIGRMTSTR